MFLIANVVHVKLDRWVLALIVMLLLTMMPQFSNATSESRNQSIPTIEDPTPSYEDTSLYMLGNCTVSVKLLESNGAIDVETENWTESEITKVQSEINHALEFLENESRPNESCPPVVDFIPEFSIEESPYEAINHPLSDMLLLMSPIITALGYPLQPGGDYITQMRDYINDFKDIYNTDWACVVFVVDDSNDDDGYFEGGGCAGCQGGGPFIYLTMNNGKERIGVEQLNKVMAHELCNVFWVKDENTDTPRYGGYLNASNTPRSGCIMDDLTISSWCISEGTKEQLGWRYTNSNIPDIINTFASIYIDSMDISGKTVNITGTTRVNPYPNLGRIGSGRNISINTITGVEYRINNGTWLNTTMVPTTVQKLMKYPNTYVDKETYAIVNFTFLTEELTPGTHNVSIRTVNSVGNAGYFNTTVEIKEFLDVDLNQDGIVNIYDLYIIAKAFGSHGSDIPNLGDPPSENWNATADMNKDNWVNIWDLYEVAIDYGKTV